MLVYCEQIQYGSYEGLKLGCIILQEKLIKANRSFLK